MSAHMIHINLNMIFYTHIEHSQSYQNNLHKVLHTHTHTHTPKRKKEREKKRTTSTYTLTHTNYCCGRNWILILGWKYCEKRKVFNLALKDDRVEQCNRMYIYIYIHRSMKVTLWTVRHAVVQWLMVYTRQSVHCWDGQHWPFDVVPDHTV